jgi:hypothetical protein
MTKETTTIEVSVETWRWLAALKHHPGESFDDVINRFREIPQVTSDIDDIPPRGNDPTYGEEDSETVPPDEWDDEDDLIRVTEPADVPGDIDLPGSGETFERRREAIGKMYAYLQKAGTATRSDFLGLISEREVDYETVESFWANSVKGRDSLRALPGVEPPQEGGRIWRYEPETQ